jgi:hypothetical protein
MVHSSIKKFIVDSSWFIVARTKTAFSYELLTMNVNQTAFDYELSTMNYELNMHNIFTINKLYILISSVRFMKTLSVNRLLQDLLKRSGLDFLIHWFNR